MEIKRFNKINEEVSESDGLNNLIRPRTIDSKHLSLFSYIDVKKLNRDGRNLYYVNNEGKLIEVKPGELHIVKYIKGDKSKLVNQIFMIEPERKDKLEELCENIHQLYDLTMKKIDTLGEVVKLQANKKED